MAQPVQVTGVDAVLKAIGRAKVKVPPKVHDALVRAAYVVLSKAKYYCPVETGNLVATGQVLSVKRTGLNSESRVVFGGHQAPYALWVHEHVWKKHKPPTCAKFLERAYREVRGTIGNMVKRELQVGTKRFIEGEEVPKVYE